MVTNEERITEQIVKLVEEMCNEATTRVRSECGVTAEFIVTVSLHQGSALITFLLVDVVSDSVRKE